VNLERLATACGARLRGNGTVPVVGITHVAQEAAPGWVFAALPGQRRHGIEFAADALARGAVAVLSDRDPGPAVAWLGSDAPRRATALAAWALAGHPDRSLRLVGVTGTNGKSTVADLVFHVAAAAGETPGCFGTVAHTLPSRTVAATRTTPEASDLAPLLGELRDAGGTVAVLEVSSHAIAMDRLFGLSFDVGVWTNLTRDHLDFHGDLESYFATKRRLGDMLRADPPGRRVIAADDPTMARLLEVRRPGDLSFGLGPGTDVGAEDVQLRESGTAFRLRAPAGTVSVQLRLVGRHNLRNALAAAAAALALDWSLEAIAAGLAAAGPLPGRLEPVATGTPFPVFVDYAHTPDALEQVLLALREVSGKRLVVVFGCGGDKDRGKRAPMGEVVGRLADVPIVTSDNPRSEDPQAIIDAVMEGVKASGNPRVLAIADRREAIAAALAVANPDSLVVVAGKGHETDQVFADHAQPFDDREVVRELARRRTA